MITSNDNSFLDILFESKEEDDKKVLEENYYIESKLVKATPMKLHDYNVLNNVQSNESDLDEEGYKITCPSGHMNWCPKNVFEKVFLKVVPNSDLNTDISISNKMVDDFIKETHIDTIGDKTTIVRVVLVNGFEIIEASSCVDKENYSQEIGAQCCLEKIKDKIWFLLGFLLQTACNGFK